MQVVLEYEDGTKGVIGSDSSWTYTTDGPIVFNDVLGGETYDARKTINGWSRDTETLSDNLWHKCKYVETPTGKITSQMLYPAKILKRFPALSVEKKDKGFQFDFGRDISGWIKIKVSGREGQKIKISYIGSNSHTLGRYQTDYFILGRDSVAKFEPRFSYKGFRFVYVEGLEYAPKRSDVTALLVGADLPKVGEFKCSNDSLNQLQSIILNTIQNFIVDIPKDPTREKSGWLQDIQSGFDVNAYNFDVSSMYTKWQYDMNDIIHENGYMPPVAPGRFDGPTINGPWWGGMIIYNVAKLYDYYGDTDIIVNSYDYMKKYMGYLNGIQKDFIISWGLGDWMEPFRDREASRPTTTPVSLTSTAAFYYFANKMAEFSKMLNKIEDEKYFCLLATQIKDSFNRTFLNSFSGRYDKGSEASQLLPLKLDITPKNDELKVRERLIEEIMEKNSHLSTGFVSTPFLLTTLSDLGYGDIAFKIATQKDFPGWFDMVFNKGHLVLKENWEGGLVQMPTLGGPLGYWFYYSLGGIRSSSPGFKKIVINPDFKNSLKWVKAKFTSVYGDIISNWEKKNKSLKIQVTIPENTMALVYLPTSKSENILIDNQKMKDFEGKFNEKTNGGKTVLSMGSGSYKITIKNFGN
jgi:alpha-L-rhamnosidase